MDRVIQSENSTNYHTFHLSNVSPWLKRINNWNYYERYTRSLVVALFSELILLFPQRMMLNTVCCEQRTKYGNKRRSTTTTPAILLIITCNDNEQYINNKRRPFSSFCPPLTLKRKRRYRRAFKLILRMFDRCFLCVFTTAISTNQL